MNFKIDGRKLRATRRKAGLTQVDLSKRTRFSQAFISRMEKGDRGGRLKTVMKLARVLKVKPESLLGGPAPVGSPFGRKVKQARR